MNCGNEDTNTIPQHAVTTSSDLTFQNCSILIWILHKLNEQVVLHQIVLSASITKMAEYTQSTYRTGDATISNQMNLFVHQIGSLHLPRARLSLSSAKVYRFTP